MTHTPGPWEVSGQLIVGPPESLPNPKAEPRGKVVASICWDYEGDRGATEPRITWNEARSNIHLIAAAPELLEALIDVVQIGESEHECDVPRAIDWDLLREVIAKAEGITL